MDNKLKVLYSFVNLKMAEAKHKSCEAMYYNKSEEAMRYNHEVIAYSTVLDKLEMYLST